MAEDSTDPSNSGGFHFAQLANGWRVGRFAALEAIAGVTHAVTTKGALDVAVIRNDHAAAAARIAEALALEQTVFVEQVHGNLVLPVAAPSEDDQRAAGRYMGQADGLVTDRPGIGVLTRGADCPLILIADPVTRSVGSAHASWRGTVQHMASHLVKAMSEIAKSQAIGIAESQAIEGRLVACICPSAGPCCYEVGPEVVRTAVEKIGPHAEAFFVRRGGQVFFDLWAANRDQLLRAGLVAHNIHVAGVCTMCRTDLFPSHRREGSAAGRYAAVIARQ